MATHAGCVLLVDDDASVRASLRRLLRSAGHEVHAFGDADRLVRSGRPAGPCCLVLDVQLPGESGLEFRESLVRAGVRIPTIFLTGVAFNVATGVRAMKRGAFDFLTKPVDADQLLSAVTSALEEDARQLAVEGQLAELRARFQTLTTREREVFFAVTRGMLNKQVAFRLGVSEKTVKVHRGRVTEKLAADSVAQLVRMADRLCPPAGLDGPADLFEPETHRPPAAHPVASTFACLA